MNKSRMSKLKAEVSSVSASELAKFAERAERWWGEAPRLRASSGRSRGAERPAMDGRAGVAHHGRFRSDE